MIRARVTRPVPNASIVVSCLHADDSLLVVDKPAGLTVEPGLAHRRDTLLNALMATHGAALSRLGESRDWGLLHRLDRETSGCVVVALRAGAYDSLRRQFESRSVRKLYLAIVRGRLRQERGVIDAPLSEVRRGAMKVSVPARRGAGRAAITRWRRLAASGDRALLAVSIETGRLHQIRAHLAWLGCPVDGDRVYRADLPPNTSPAPRGRAMPPLLLHAWRLSFRHPGTGRRISVEAPPPPTLAEAAIAVAGGNLTSLLESVASDDLGFDAE